MNTRIIFERLGLPKHASTIYTLLRQKGPLPPTHIAAHTRLHRPSVYRALTALRAKHFVYTTPLGRRQLYHAAPPTIITASFAQASAKVPAAFVKQVIANDQYHRKDIRFLSGFSGIQEAFKDVVLHLRRGETFYRYTSERDLERVNRYLPKDYRMLRDQKKLERMVISNPVSGSQKKSRLERFIKFIPPRRDLFDQNIIQLIYGNRLSLIDLNTERVLIIENKALADFQKVIFKQLYDKLPLP